MCLNSFVEESKKVYIQTKSLLNLTTSQLMGSPKNCLLADPTEQANKIVVVAL